MNSMLQRVCENMLHCIANKWEIDKRGPARVSRGLTGELPKILSEFVLPSRRVSLVGRANWQF